MMRSNMGRQVGTPGMGRPMMTRPVMTRPGFKKGGSVKPLGHGCASKGKKSCKIY